MKQEESRVIWEMKRARRARIVITHINTEEETARCGRCRHRWNRDEGWEVPARCPKCGIYINGVAVES